MIITFIFVLQLARRIISLLPLPEWSESETVRKWASQKLLPMLQDMAAETESELDDKLTKAMADFVSEPAKWDAFYGTILDIIGTFDNGAIPGENDPRIRRLADDAKVDPATIIAIIMAVIEAIQWWRNRNQTESQAA